MKTLFTLTLLTIAGLTAACNTVQGLGQDVESGGEHIQKSAE